MRILARTRFGDGHVCQLRVELAGFSPPIWRRLLLSDRASLHELHLVIAGALQGEDSGDYRFRIDGVEYADADSGPAPGHAADRVALADLGLHSGASFQHIAESHSDRWRHVVTLEQETPRLVGQRLPACIAGGQAAPPAECGGPHAFRELLDALADPFGARAAEWREWLPPEFDPGYADLTGINAALARVPKRRPAA